MYWLSVLWLTKPYRGPSVAGLAVEPAMCLGVALQCLACHVHAGAADNVQQTRSVYLMDTCKHVLQQATATGKMCLQKLLHAISN